MLVSVTITFFFGISLFPILVPNLRVVPLWPLFLVFVLSLLRYLTVPESPGIYVSWYIMCSGHGYYPPANTSTFYSVFMFLSCAETTLEDAYQPLRSPFITVRWRFFFFFFFFYTGLLIVTPG